MPRQETLDSRMSDQKVIALDVMAVTTELMIVKCTLGPPPHRAANVCTFFTPLTFVNSTMRAELLDQLADQEVHPKGSD